MSSIIYTKNEPPIFFIPKICFVTNGREVLTEFMQIKIIARKFKFHNFVFYMLNKIIQCLDQSFFVVIGYTIFIRTNRITISAGTSGFLLPFFSAAISGIMPQKASFSKTFCHKLPDFT